MNPFEQPIETLIDIRQFFENWAAIEGYLETQLGWHMAVATVIGGIAAALPFLAIAAIPVLIFRWIKGR